MKLTYVIVTRSRCDALPRTLDALERNTGLPRYAWEAVVVDNASADAAAAAVTARHDAVHLVRADEDEGPSAARTRAMGRAAGRYVAFLDDNAYPLPGTMPGALGHLARHPRTAAVVGRLDRQGGGAEAPAFPAVTLSGATVYRADALRQVGPFAPELAGPAAEHDLSFRLWRAGHRVERFDDLAFARGPAGDYGPRGAPDAAARRLDLRNDLILVERYLPRPLRRACRRALVRRHAALALHAGHGPAVNAALHEARVWARRERVVGRQTLDAATVEKVFGLEAQAAAVGDWARRHAVRRVVIADWGENLWATLAACRRARVEVAAVADNHPAFAAGAYRGIPVVRDDQAAALAPDGVVLSTVNPALVGPRADRLAAAFAGPVLTLWEPRWIEPRADRPAIGGAVRSVA